MKNSTHNDVIKPAPATLFSFFSAIIHTVFPSFQLPSFRLFPTSNSRLPTANYQLSTINYQLIFLLTILLCGTARAQPLGCFGKLEGTAGAVEFRTRATDTWQPALPGMCLFEDTTLRTGSRGGALIVLDDLSEIRVNENSEIQFVDVIERFRLTRLSGVSLRGGEIYLIMSAGYDPIMIESVSAAAVVQAATADIILRPDDPKLGSEFGTTVFVAGGAVDVYDVYLQHRLTVGTGQQTNVTRLKPPQSAYFYNKEKFDTYVNAWKNPLKPGKAIEATYKNNDLADLRGALLGCPEGFYGRGLWCCPETCGAGPSNLPQDIFCPDGTYYIGNRQCCDNECW